MREALRTKLAAGELATREAVDEALGPDDDRRDTPQVRDFLLESPGLGFPWYVRIEFDEAGEAEGLLDRTPVESPADDEGG